MELIKILLSILGNDKIKQTILPLFSHLQNNDFDLKKAIECLTPEIVSPLISTFSELFTEQNKSPKEPSITPSGILPISNIADKDIIYNLNKLLSV